MRRAVVVVFLVAVASVALPAALETSAAAQPRTDTIRLHGLSASERAALMPLLAHGAVSLIESNDDGSLKQVTIATIVRAPAAAIYALIAQPEIYPSFVPNISTTRVLERHRNMVAYEWQWHGVMVDLTGRDALTLYPPGRIDMDATGGDLGRGRFRWELFPLPDNRTLLVHTFFSDVRQANYMMRQLVASDASMMHAMNLSSGFVLLMGVKTKVEQLAGTGDGRRPTGGVSGRGDLRNVAGWARPELLPLLHRGEIAVVQMDRSARVQQATVIGRIGADPAAVRRVLLDPAHYHSVMPHVASTSIVEEGEDGDGAAADGGVTFDWEVVFPVINITGRMHLRGADPDRVLLDSPSGDLSGGRWMWEVEQLGGETVVLYSSRANLARANWFLGALIGQDPFFLHGLSCASNLVTVRAIQHHFAH